MYGNLYYKWIFTQRVSMLVLMDITLLHDQVKDYTLKYQKFQSLF